MTKSGWFTWVALALGGPWGCVTQGTYDAMKAERDATQQELANARRTVQQRDQVIAVHQQTEAELRADVLALEKEKAELEAKLAAVLKDKSSLQSSVAEMTTALAELEKRKEQADSRLAEFRALVGRFRKLIDAGKLQVRIVDGRMVVSLATDVLFASGSATLSADGKAAIAEVSQLLSTIPNRTFQVEGHTDNVPIATAQYPSNWELASARALRVVKAMMEAGMPPDRISAASFAEFKPQTSNDNPEGRAQNRRIEIIVVPDLSSLPGFEELNRVQEGS